MQLIRLWAIERSSVDFSLCLIEMIDEVRFNFNDSILIIVIQ